MATYYSLQVVETITQIAEGIVKTMLPIQEWVKDLALIPKTRVVQAQMVVHRVTYMGQHSCLSSLPRKEELQNRVTSAGQNLPSGSWYNCQYQAKGCGIYKLSMTVQAEILTQECNVACILPWRADLPVLVPVRHLFYSS